MKAEKGITLVALVITIIVLLILAMVSISIVMNQGIMEKSKDAADKYNQAAANEQEQIQWTEDTMDYLMSNMSVSNSSTNELDNVSN